MNRISYTIYGMVGAISNDFEWPKNPTPGVGFLGVGSQPLPTKRPDSIFRLWRSIKHLLTYLLTYLLTQCHSRSLKIVLFEILDTVVSYSHSIATMAVCLAVSTQYTNTTDTHRPSQTLHDDIDRAYAQHRAPMNLHFIFISTCTRGKMDKSWQRQSDRQTDGRSMISRKPWKTADIQPKAAHSACVCQLLQESLSYSTMKPRGCPYCAGACWNV